jgi:hypothetical protein
VTGVDDDNPPSAAQHSPKLCKCEARFRQVLEEKARDHDVEGLSAVDFPWRMLVAPGLVTSCGISAANSCFEPSAIWPRLRRAEKLLPNLAIPRRRRFIPFVYPRRQFVRANGAVG